MEEIPYSKRRKIEETVLNILKNADLETATEYSVRATASEELCIDLSDLASKICVRRVVESFLLSSAAPIPTTTLDDVGSVKVTVSEENKHAEVEIEEEQQKGEIRLSNGSLDSTVNNGRVICKLSDKRSLAIHDFKGQTLVSIRDYYRKDGKQFPSGRGITLTGRQWSCFRNSFPAIEESIAQMQTRIRSAVEKLSEENMPSSVDDVAIQGSVAIDQNQMETAIPNAANDFNPQSDNIRKRKHERLSSIDSPTILSSVHQIAIERHQSQADTRASLSAAVTQGHVLHNQLASHRQGLVPIMTTRLNGKNYHCWMHQMEFFLKQLKVAYVLTNPCHSIPSEGASFEEITQAKAAAKKWADDEYICRHSILNSLSDNLFDQYSKQGCSAKELWEELKSVYAEDFGTVRSEVNKYIQFQMVDGISVLEQVQELNYIANAITASGIWIDENLHVSVIISKLPPSWKEFRAKLMYHEFLPLNMLLHLLKVEEESRNHEKKENLSKNAHADDNKVENRFEPKKKEGKRLCYTCGKEGHISKYCRDRKGNDFYPRGPTTWCEEMQNS